MPWQPSVGAWNSFFGWFMHNFHYKVWLDRTGFEMQAIFSPSTMKAVDLFLLECFGIGDIASFPAKPIQTRCSLLSSLTYRTHIPSYVQQVVEPFAIGLQFKRGVWTTKYWKTLAHHNNKWEYADCSWLSERCTRTVPNRNVYFEDDRVFKRLKVSIQNSRLKRCV